MTSDNIKTKTTASRTAEHILVCLSASPSNAKIIRTAATMAAAFGGTFTALYVQTPDSSKLCVTDKTRLSRNIELAKELGATISTIYGEEVSYQIAEFARLSGVTKIVIGRSGITKRHFWSKPTLTEQLINIAPNLDIHIIPDTAAITRYHSGKKKFAWHLLPTFNDLLITAIILTLTTLIGLLFLMLGLTEANIIMIYLLGVLLASLFTKGYLCSVISSFLSVSLFNYFFTEPRLTFHAYHPGYPITFAIMLAASIITGTLASRLKAHAKLSAKAAFKTQILFDTNQLLQKAKDDTDILNITTDQLKKLLNRDVNIYYNPESTLGISMQTDGRQPDAFENSIVTSILGECALAIENNRNVREKEQAAVLAKNEQLRANLLRTISHDLRTPLTAISGNADNLLSNYDKMDAATRLQSFTDIYDDSMWLIKLVENILSVTRIEENRMNFNMSAELISEVIDEALRHINRKSTEHNIIVEYDNDLLLAYMDSRLIVQVIINIIDNAIKYTPCGSTIKLTVSKKNDMIYTSIADNGPGIPDKLKSNVFEMFFTGDNKIADNRRSLGLGLALCKSIINAHGGELTLTDNTPHGAVFTFTLPANEVTIYE